MPYQEEFDLFWSQVEASVEEGIFAKLTMAKTIGKQPLKNIFVRPYQLEGDYKFLVKYHYRARDVKDKEEELDINKTLELIKSHLQQPFFSVLLFTTEKDVTFKINKKGAGSLIENTPTFTEVILADKDYE